MFRRWILPGLLFQSVMVGGGYATGRELVEFFLSYGALGGLLGLLLVTVMFSVAAAIFLEFARLTRSLTYSHFFGALLGRGWRLFEAGYLLLGMLVLAVVGAAAGEIGNGILGIGTVPGTLLLCALVLVVVYHGTGFLERVLASWSLLLYAVYLLFITLFLLRYGDGVPGTILKGDRDPYWFLGSVQYVGYNLVVLPAIVFCVAHLEDRRDSLVAGLFCGPLAMIPAVLFYLAMCADPQAIRAAPVPADYMIRKLDIEWLSLLFYVTIFGTFIETGSAFIHSLNQRIAESRARGGIDFAHRHRALVAAACLVISIGLAESVGLINLVARGYVALTWYFLLVFVLPLLVVGLPRVLRSAEQKPAGTPSDD